LQYCGRSAPNVELEIDYVVPWSTAKKHEFENLATSCKECIQGKSNLLLAEEEL